MIQRIKLFMPIIITAVTNIVLKMKWQYPRRKTNFLALTRKQTIEYFFISIVLYQEAQFLCELMTPTLWWLLCVINTFLILWKFGWKQDYYKVKTTYDLQMLTAFIQNLVKLYARHSQHTTHWQDATIHHRFSKKVKSDR